jgi:prepilin-type processing-associated H-X9-DG protein
MKTAQSEITRSSNGAGFARQDLLASAAVLLLLLAIQVPLLGGGQAADASATCRNNLRRLIQAWLMYAEENRGRITPNNGSNPNEPLGTWVAGWLDYTASFDNVNVAYLMAGNERHGMLGPYLKDASVFRCPSDASQVTIFGRRQNRVRSVAMNNWMGGSAYCGQSNFREFRKTSDIIGLAPSDAWVIMDQREDSINDAWFAVNMLENLVEFPGSYHNGGANLAFSDGHVGYRAWQDKRTNPELVKGTLLALQAPSPDNPDLHWLRARSTVEK